jgi:hypothetical protein
MTLKERLLAVMQHRQPDVMPWFSDLTYWYGASAGRGTLPERWQGEGVVDLYRDLNTGCHEHALNSPWKTEHEDVETVVETETDSGGAPTRQKVEWRTPVGTITQIKSYEPIAYTWAYRQYPVRTPDDLKVLRFIREHEHVTPDYSRQEHQLQLWGDVGVCASVPPRNPMADLIVIWMGVMNVVYALADAPDEVEHTLEVLGAADDPIYEIIAGSPAPLVYFPDNITGEVVSPSIFGKYYAPYYKRRVPGLHAAGLHIFLHIDGTVRPVLPLVAETGIDAAQSLTPAPVGDVPVPEMRALAGPDLIVWGGVPAAFFSPVYPESVLRDIVMDCIRCFPRSDNFILGVCDQVPPDGVIERVKLVADLVEEHARYE